MKILKVVTYDWKNASRDKRELSLYKEMGHEVIVMCKGENNDCMRSDNVDGFNVIRFSTKPLGNKFPDFINKIAGTILWVKYIIKISPDVISGENPKGAFLGAIAKNIIKEKNIKLIYDAHEFHLYAGVMSKFQQILMNFVEKRILKCSDLTIVVNDSILKEMRNIYRFNWNAISLLSVPSTFTIDPDKVRRIREYYDSKINTNHDKFIIEYHGNINRMRNVELLLKMLQVNENLSLILIGNVHDEYKQELINFAKEIGVLNRILFHSAVPICELGNYLNATDLGVIIFKVFYKNIYYTLPNKFFETIQSENPIVCSDFPELRKIIEEYEIGMLVDGENLETVNSVVEKLRVDKVLYNRLKRNTVIAKKKFCWENEKHKLKDAFEKMLRYY